MYEPDPHSWTTSIWHLVISAGVFAYVVRLLDKIQGRRTRTFFVEVLELIVCVGISFGVYYMGSLVSNDERIIWLCSVYSAHKGTRWVFARLDNAARIHLDSIGGGNVKDSSKNNT